MLVQAIKGNRHTHLHPAQDHFATLEAMFLLFLDSLGPPVQCASTCHVLDPQNYPLKHQALMIKKCHLRAPAVQGPSARHVLDPQDNFF